MKAFLRRLRAVLFWLHLAGGLLAGLIILLLAVTGILLTYERQILEKFDGYQIQVVTEDFGRVPLEDIVAEIATTPSSVTLDSEDGSAVQLNFGKGKVLYVNPYTGQSMGEGAARLRGFFSFVTALHRWLALQGDYRQVGMAVTGAAAILFLGLIISGLVLWFPRRWSWIFVRRILWFQPRLHGPARQWNWHHVIGFWCCLPLLLITVTGIVMTYDWANRLVYTLAGSPLPQARQTGTGHKGERGGTAQAEPASLAGLETATQKVLALYPQWRSMNIHLPTKPDAPVIYTVSESHRGRADKKTQIWVQLPAGEIISTERFSDYSLGKKLRFFARWIHTGEAADIVGQTIAGLASLGSVFLVWTGFALAWRRLKRPPAARTTVPH